MNEYQKSLFVRGAFVEIMEMIKEKKNLGMYREEDFIDVCKLVDNLDSVLNKMLKS